MPSLTILLPRLPRRLPRLARLARYALPPVGLWTAVSRERHRLAALSDDALHDIGISRTQARREAARPFWDLPTR